MCCALMLPSRPLSWVWGSQLRCSKMSVPPVHRDPEPGVRALIQMSVTGVEQQERIVGLDVLLQVDEQLDDPGLGRLLVEELVDNIDVVPRDQDFLAAIAARLRDLHRLSLRPNVANSQHHGLYLIL